MVTNKMYIASLIATKEATETKIDLTEKQAKRLKNNKPVKLKALAIPLELGSRPAITHAATEDEAMAFFQGLVEQIYPKEDGWTNHIIQIEIVPEEVRTYLDRNA